MRFPIRYLMGNLAWSASGIPWAIWRVHPVSYVHATARARQDLHATTTAVLKRLTGEPVLLSLCAQVDATAVAERMIAGVDLSTCPAWAETADATLDLLCDLDLSERTHWLAVPLPVNTTGQDRLPHPGPADLLDRGPEGIPGAGDQGRRHRTRSRRRHPFRFPARLHQGRDRVVRRPDRRRLRPRRRQGPHRRQGLHHARRRRSRVPPLLRKRVLLTP